MIKCGHSWVKIGNKYYDAVLSYDVYICSCCGELKEEPRVEYL